MSERAAVAQGARDAFGVPAAVLAAGYLGFGAFASASGVSVWFTLVSSFAIWALPAQLVLVEMGLAGAPVAAVALAVMLTNARFLPMAIALMPVLRDDSHPRWRYYLAVHLMAMAAWTMSMRRCPAMPAPERLPYFAGFGFICVASCAVAAAAGHLLAGSIPAQVRLGLVFLTPLFLFVILTGETRGRPGVLALACGALAAPLLHVLTPQWSVLLTGFGGGSLAFLIHKLWAMRS